MGFNTSIHPLRYALRAFCPKSGLFPQPVKPVPFTQGRGSEQIDRGVLLLSVRHLAVDSLIPRRPSAPWIALMLAALLASGWPTSPAFAQQPAPKPVPAKPAPAQSSMGGIASAGTFAPVYDAEKRPITAGGFVDNGTVVFEDVTKAAGPGWLAARDGHRARRSTSWRPMAPAWA